MYKFASVFLLLFCVFCGYDAQAQNAKLNINIEKEAKYFQDIVYKNYKNAAELDNDIERLNVFRQYIEDSASDEDLKYISYISYELQKKYYSPNIKLDMIKRQSPAYAKSIVDSIKNPDPKYDKFFELFNKFTENKIASDWKTADVSWARLSKEQKIKMCISTAEECEKTKLVMVCRFFMSKCKPYAETTLYEEIRQFILKERLKDDENDN